MKRLIALLLIACSPAWAQHYRQPSQMSLDGTFTFATLPTASTYTGYTAYTSDQGPVYSDGSAWHSMSGGGIPPTIATNTVLGNATNATAAPTALAVGTCSTSSSALKWTTNTGFGCNTSIDAATLGGATFAAPGSIGSGTASAGAFSTLSATGQITSTLATGTAPFSIASTTNVANLNASLLNGATFAAPGAIGGGTAAAGAFTTLSATGQITSTLAIGTAPFAVTSTTNVANLNASLLNGTTFAAPAAIGSGTPAAGNFTTLGASALFTGTLGATISAAAISLNDSSNFNTTINTGTSTGTVTVGQNASSPSAIVLAGPLSFQAGTAKSGASWSTTSPVWNGVAMTLNDTTASGTVPQDVAYSLQAPNFTSTGGASTTLTNAVNLFIAAPTCSGGLVCTNLLSINTPGRINGSGGLAITSTVNLNVSANAATNINTGSSNSTVTIGGGSNAVTINATTLTLGGSTIITSTSPFTNSNAAFKLTGITTGTNADTVCYKSDGTLLIQAAACTISSLRFKEAVKPFNGDALGTISGMDVRTFRMKPDAKRNPDKNAYRDQIGLIAENIAKIEPRCAIYEQDMKTPKSYRQECVIALLVAGEQELLKQNRELKARLVKLETH